MVSFDVESAEYCDAYLDELPPLGDGDAVSTDTGQINIMRDDDASYGAEWISETCDVRRSDDDADCF